MTATSDAHYLCMVNGQPQMSLTVADRGLAYGDGLFETIRFQGRYVPVWPLHWQRLKNGAAVLGLDLDADEISNNLEAALNWAQSQAVDDGVAKIIVTRGTGGRGYAPPTNPELNVIVIVKPYQRPITASANGLTDIELKDCSYRLCHNPVLAGLKHLNRLEQVLAARSVVLDEGQHGLVLDEENRIIETLHHNLFLVRDGTLITADLSRCGVAGTLRRAILESFAPALDLCSTVQHLYAADLANADEVFICNAVHGITPVNRWQDRTWKKGAVTEQLMQCIARRWNNFYD